MSYNRCPTLRVLSANRYTTGPLAAEERGGHLTCDVSDVCLSVNIGCGMVKLEREEALWGHSSGVEHSTAD
ncbi:hypothetical protein L596_025241 [Steinernema carpocapsae]|uniref:Uncharacterized protein n=1 Tax=Steinernema carpocapsae TaxID=34508 RepID=A0A4V5ZYR4_STECR|nr:hypothetical protein L596_025241 [Steinernema carpocapsae]